MATATATLSNFRQSPRKMRLVANLVRGKKVADVLTNLDFTTKRASLPVKTLIMSALANAKAQDIPTDNLIVQSIEVNAGKTMYRRKPAARGSAHPIRKRTCAVYVVLGEGKVGKEAKKVKVAKEAEVAQVEKPKAVKKTTKKVTTKAK